MAYKLNLVTMDIRKRMVDPVKDEVVHNKEKGYILTDEKKDEKQDQDTKKYKSKKKRYLTVDAIKDTNKRIDVSAEIDKDVLNKEPIGLFIDKKK